MTGLDSFYWGNDSSAERIEFADGSGNISLKIALDRLLVTVSGEPGGEVLLQCFHSGIERKLLHGEMRALVDLTDFIGVIDWGAIFAVRQMAPWGESKKDRSCVAYLLPDGYAELMIKAVSDLFTHTQHRAFTSRELAITWLETQPTL